MRLHNTPAAVWDEGAGLDMRINSQSILTLQCMVTLALFISAPLSICFLAAVLYNQDILTHSHQLIYYRVGYRGLVQTMTKCTLACGCCLVTARKERKKYCFI